MIAVDAALANAAPDPAAAPVSARAVVEAQLAMLSRLAELGMAVAEAVGAEAAAAAPRAAGEAGSDAQDAPAPSPAERRDAALVFARVARAVRMTLALQSRVLKDRAALDRADALDEMRRKDDRRLRLSRLVGEAARAGVEAQRQAGTRRWSDEDAIEDEIDRLSCDAYERLTDAEDCAVWDLSFDEVVAAVARDLGLSADGCARLRDAVTPPAPPTAPTATAVPPLVPPPVIPGPATGRNRGSSRDEEGAAPPLEPGGPRPPGPGPSPPPEDDGVGAHCCATAPAPPPSG